VLAYRPTGAQRKRVDQGRKSSQGSAREAESKRVVHLSIGEVGKTGTKRLIGTDGKLSQSRSQDMTNRLKARKPRQTLRPKCMPAVERQRPITYNLRFPIAPNRQIFLPNLPTYDLIAWSYPWNAR
jgi:hypothetical protein